MTQAELTRTIKYVLAESSRWLMHRRGDTKRINIPGCRKKIRKEEKNEKRKVGIKVQKQENSTQGVSISIIFLSLLQGRDGDLATPSTILFLLSSATVSSVTAAAVEPPPPRTTQRKPNKTAWTRGL